MKKIFSFILIIVAMIMISSCGTAVKVGEGYGFSDNLQMSMDKAYASAMTDISFHDKTVVNSKTTINTKDVNGKPMEVTQTKKTVKTEGIYTDVRKDYTITKKNGGFFTHLSAKAKREE